MDSCAFDQGIASKELEAGNINSNLPSTQFVNVGSGKSEGLFGIKIINKIYVSFIEF